MNHANSGGSLTLEVLIRAPAERVFTALTNPEERVKWWGAEGRFKAPTAPARSIVAGRRSSNGSARTLNGPWRTRPDSRYSSTPPQALRCEK
jgi:uncharacterized protein YndB with AHSA1/START domain